MVWDVDVMNYLLGRFGGKNVLECGIKIDERFSDDLREGKKERDYVAGRMVREMTPHLREKLLRQPMKTRDMPENPEMVEFRARLFVFTEDEFKGMLEDVVLALDGYGEGKLA